MTESNGLVVLGLVAENFKRLKAIEIRPDPEEPIVFISGPNEAGKTAVLDSISAVIGGARLCPKVPIRTGEESARVEVKLGKSEVEFTAERRWTKAGTALKVYSASGQRYSTPQAFLEEIMGEVGFDPMEFERKKLKDQITMLLKASRVDIDLKDLDYKRKDLYRSREKIGRDVKRITGALDSVAKVPPGIPDDPVSVTGLSTELQAAVNQQNDVNLAEQQLDRRRHRVRGLLNDKKSKEAEIERLRAEIERLRAEANGLTGQIDEEQEAGKEAATKLEQMKASLPDIDKIRNNITNAEVINRHVQNRNRAQEMRLQLEGAKAEYDEHTKSINEIDKTKQRALTEATERIPVKGLSLGEDDIFLNGIPLSESSRSQQFRLSLAIAMALNPTLRVLRITDGALLDSKSMEIIREMAVANGDDIGYQVWIELVDETGEVGFVINEGRVITMEKNELEVS
jgi:DNA repair exonuclease SbcCD ATPase subunit